MDRAGKTRRFVDAPQGERCTATITLRDGTTANCGRYAKVGTLCTQHAKMTRAATPTRGDARNG